MNSQDVQTLINKARQKHQEGDFSGALDFAQKANRTDPGLPDPYVLMGQCHRLLGRPKEAIKIFEMLQKHFPDEGDLDAEIAQAHWDLGEKETAYEIAKKGAAKKDSSVFALSVWGEIAKNLGYWQQAIDCFEKLTVLSPKTLKYHGFLAESYGSCYRNEEAARAFENFIKLQGENARNTYQMGMFLFLAKLFEEAVPWFEKAAKLDPENEQPVFYMARCFIQFGDLKKGEELVWKALDIKPDSIHSLTLLNELDPEKIKDEHTATLFKNLEEDRFEGPLEKAMTYLFLGRYYHKMEKYDEAFNYFKSANEERYKVFSNEGLFYDQKLMEGNFSETKRIFTKERMEKMTGAGSDSEIPILIVSMPRSGTTLLEQIIASHSKVHGAGEMSAMSRIFFDLNYKINLDLKKPVEEVIRENSAEWSEIYLNELRAPEGILRATDKMPVNFIHLGLFQAMFPKARVIYIKRHPLDTCLSMYSNNLSHSFAYTAKQENLAHYFNLHADLMRHWRENLDMKYLEVSYPALVENPEEKAREILDFCGLEWEAKVLEFYKGRKAAYTISQVQVSEPINKKGLGRWVPYKKYIGPLIEGLDEDIVGPLGVDD